MDSTTGEPMDDYLEGLKGKFGWPEYVVFGVVLSLSAGIGIFYGFFSKLEKNNEEFLMGKSRQMYYKITISRTSS
jgi:sodium-coupled monocarboxylate transporter 8/12